MIFVPATHFHIYLPSLGARLAQCLSCVLNVKVVVAAFNQEKALEGAFSVIMNLRVNLRLKLCCVPGPGRGGCYWGRGRAWRP